MKNFNSQPHKGADCASSPAHRCYQYFNSQPHKGADGITLFDYPLKIISTHSPTRGLTTSKSVKRY